MAGDAPLAFGVEPAAFAAHVAAIAARGAAPAESLTDDLVLAFAAGSGNPAAIAAFERDILPAATAALHAVRATASVIDDCLQRVRIALLVGRDDGRPRLLDYRGHGALRAWVRVVALRENLMAHRGQARADVPLGDAILASVPDAADDPELRYMRGELRDQLAAAITAGLAELDARDRALLRYALIDGLSLDEIAPIYAVHKSSVSRWLARARERLWQVARTKLTAQLTGRTAEIASLVANLRTGLDLSLERLLAPD